MKHVIAVLWLVVALLFLYRHYSRNGRSTVAGEEKLRWKLGKTPPISGNSRNCTFTSCYDSGRCVLNTTHVTIFLQPLLEVVDENDRLLTPVPSREFLEIRDTLRPFSVAEPESACLSLPGVDFLNFERFGSEEDVLRIVSALKTNLPNVFIVNFLGRAPLLDVMLISALPARSTYRQQFDLSIPLILLPEEGIEGEEDGEEERKEKLLLVPLVSISSGQRQDVVKEMKTMGKNATLLSECPDDSSKICDDTGKKSNLEDQIKSHRFVLLLDSSPLFPRLLTLALRHGTIPILFSDSVILPYSNLIEWSEYALAPSAVSRIPRILERMSEFEAETRAERCRRLYREMFSSPAVVIENVVNELETKLLPFSTRASDGQCLPLLPHMTPTPTLCAFVIASDSSVIRRVSSLCRGTTVSKIVVLWPSSSQEDPPREDEWICKKAPISVVFGVDAGSGVIAAARRNSQCRAILIVPEGDCGVKERAVEEAIAIWQSNPHALVHLPAGKESCRSPFIIHNSYLSHCLTEKDVSSLIRSGDLSSLPSIFMSDKEVVTDRRV